MMMFARLNYYTNHCSKTICVMCNSYSSDTVPIEYDDQEFVWEDYLEETGALAAPDISFQHVSRP